MEKTASEKRKQYFAENPEVYNQYLEIKQEISQGGGENNNNKFENIKKYATEHTSFYKNFSLNDVFPIMTKVDYIKNRNSIQSNEIFTKPLHTSSTSGSTGIPFSVTQNYEKRARVIAELKVFGDYADYPSHEKMIQTRTYHGIQLDRTIDEKENIYRYDICDMSDNAIEKLIQYMQEWKPRAIMGYASTINTIADYILTNKKQVRFDELKSIIVGAEVLSYSDTERITQVFGCPIYDRYADMEMGILAQRKAGETDFMLNTSSYYFEFLKLDKDEPVKEGETGRIVITDFYNHSFPMIRYDTGDLGSYCLNNGKIEIKEIFGRKLDSIFTPDGLMINPHTITRKFREVKNILQYQFIQKDTNKYLIKINANGKVDENDILQKLYDVMGNKAVILLEYTDDIPVSNSQKRRAIINEMKK